MIQTYTDYFFLGFSLCAIAMIIAQAVVPDKLRFWKKKEQRYMATLLGITADKSATLIKEVYFSCYKLTEDEINEVYDYTCKLAKEQGKDVPVFNIINLIRLDR